MKNNAGDAVFGDGIDALLSEKIVAHSLQTASGEEPVAAQQPPSVPPAPPCSCSVTCKVVCGILAFAVAILLIERFTKRRR
jgi:hypothetical protein